MTSENNYRKGVFPFKYWTNTTSIQVRVITHLKYLMMFVLQWQFGVLIEFLEMLYSFFVYLSYFYWNNKGILIWSYSTFVKINESYNNICRKCRFWSYILNWISLIKHWDKRYPLRLWKESATIAPLNKQALCQGAFLLFHTNLIKIKIMHF